uniref:Uncharacterized protein n=1 Tax=Arion vulgaris TaxID=1028688 RepID=A0A0B7A7I2_9EUPU
MNSLSKLQFNVDTNPVCGHDYPNTTERTDYVGNSNRMELVFHTAKSDDSSDSG